VNDDRLYQAMARHGAFINCLLVVSLDWKIQTLTPSPDVIYCTPSIDTAELGPVMLALSPADEGSITGIVMDAWQCALEDVGAFGADQAGWREVPHSSAGYRNRVPAGYIRWHPIRTRVAARCRRS
jgi:hypothetical protein